MAFINIQKKFNRRVKTTQIREYSKIYNDSRWSALRDWKFRHNPICEECEKAGITSPTQEVHHIIKFVDGRTPNEIQILAFSIINLMSLCIKCHKKKHERYQIDYDLRQKLLKY